MYIEVEETDCEGSSYIDHLDCEQHLRWANYILRIGGVLIPLCQECLDDLNNELSKYVTPQSKE